jgi:hypothetical protein
MLETTNPNPSEYIPNPKLHLYISLVKSGLRLGAGTALIYADLTIAGALLIAAELLGIAEELV